MKRPKGSPCYAAQPFLFMVQFLLDYHILLAAAAALTQARFSTVLSSSAEITVFAPNNAAVLNITRNELDYLYNIRNNKTLYNSLAFGATAAALPTSSFANGQVLPTLDGSFTHTVHVYGPEIQIDAATITSADRKADNGFVNKVRSVCVLCAGPCVAAMRRRSCVLSSCALASVTAPCR